jgi:hypothetical protein
MSTKSNSTSVWKWRLPVVLSFTALAIALLGSTSVGHAFSSGVAKRAVFAKNAGAVNGIKASKQPRPGRLLPLGPDGKFPASVGLAGPRGPQGLKGEKGDKGDTGDTGAQGPAGTSGLSGYGYYVQGQDVAKETVASFAVLCPAGQKPLGGGVSSTDPTKARITENAPIIDPTETGWAAGVYNGGTATIAAYVWAICANVA